MTTSDPQRGDLKRVTRLGWIYADRTDVATAVCKSHDFRRHAVAIADSRYVLKITFIGERRGNHRALHFELIGYAQGEAKHAGGSVQRGRPVARAPRGPPKTGQPDRHFAPIPQEFGPSRFGLKFAVKALRPPAGRRVAGRRGAFQRRCGLKAHAQVHRGPPTETMVVVLILVLPMIFALGGCAGSSAARNRDTSLHTCTFLPQDGLPCAQAPPPSDDSLTWTEIDYVNTLTEAHNRVLRVNQAHAAADPQ